MSVLDIPGTVIPEICALNDTDIAYIDGDQLRTYHFNGDDWIKNDKKMNYDIDEAWAAITSKFETEDRLIFPSLDEFKKQMFGDFNPRAQSAGMKTATMVARERERALTRPNQYHNTHGIFRDAEMHIDNSASYDAITIIMFDRYSGIDYRYNFEPHTWMMGNQNAMLEFVYNGLQEKIHHAKAIKNQPTINITMPASTNKLAKMDYVKETKGPIRDRLQRDTDQHLKKVRVWLHA